MVKVFRVELSLLAWALVFVAVGFYFMGRTVQAADQVPVTTPVTASGAAQIVSPTELLSRIHQIDLEEIQLGQLAQTQSQSKEVKKLGDRMVKDHKANEKDLLALAKSQNITLREPAALTPQDQAQQEANKATATRLKTLKGAEFDKEYSKAMAAGHQAAIAMVKNANPPDLMIKRYLEKLRPVLEQHDHLAMGVVKDVKSE